MPSIGNRQCISCRLLLPPSDFYPRRGSRVDNCCRKCTLRKSRAYAKANPVRYKAWQRKYEQSLKLEMVAHYSDGANKCDCCGEERLEFLTLDHPDNKGGEERRRLGKPTGAGFYRVLRKLDYPPGYKILCYNCNCGRARQPDKVCPHKKPPLHQ